MGRLEAKLGEQIRVLRTARELTQEALARRSRLSVDSIRRMERGDFSPSIFTLSKLAAGLGVSLYTLFSALERNQHSYASQLCDLLARLPRRQVLRAEKLIYALVPAREPA